jgi:RNA polymerase sigma-70 factor (ECF subfamily)
MLAPAVNRPQPAAPREDERALVAACVAGDEAAWERFHARFHPLVLARAERALRRLGVDDPASLAADVAGDVFSELLTKDKAALARFEGRSSLATWLSVLTRRRAAKTLRRKRPGGLAEPERIKSRGPTPSDVALLSERDQLVRDQLAELPERDRLALQLFYEGGRSYKQVAATLGLGPERVGTILARARKRLGEALEGKLD